MFSSFVGGDLSDSQVDFLAAEGRDYFLTHGMIYKNKSGNLGHRPFTVLPTPIPTRLFTAAREVQKDFNLLVHKASQDFQFTKEALLSTITADVFTARIFAIYEKSQEHKIDQPTLLGIFRSDYMIEQTSGSHKEEEEKSNLCIKQVELNTVSISAISSSCRASSLHRHLLNLLGEDEKSMPPNFALDEVAKGLIKAWELYGSPSAVIMFIVRPDEVNVYVQRILEYSIRNKNRAVKVIRRGLTEVFTQSEVHGDKSLFVDGLEVAVAYFRAGYTPVDYPSEDEWSARLTIELSRCVKCPTVGHQLMGTKKMQQVFSEPGVLERFLPSREAVDRVRATFTGLYTLDPVCSFKSPRYALLLMSLEDMPPEIAEMGMQSMETFQIARRGPLGDHNVECCLQKVERFVMKPQREGGGNLIYGEDIRHTLQSNPEKRAQYILMDRIQPACINKNFVVRQESVKPAEIISELGIFGIFLSRGDEILVNKDGGFVLRSRPWDKLEVISLHGEGAYSSPYLVD